MTQKIYAGNHLGLKNSMLEHKTFQEAILLKSSITVPCRGQNMLWVFSLQNALSCYGMSQFINSLTEVLQRKIH